MAKMRQGRPKMAQPASKVSPNQPKCAHLEPLLPTLAALLATWGIPLRIFTHFYEVFVNNCAFFLKINENPRKIKQIALKIMNIAQKHRKGC
ncbi:MAG: hypothetical protein GY820_01540 [Gammaproteobacteria bacterium]|nr:hypothetical protein [Gammaproteobacteria bacterium]